MRIFIDNKDLQTVFGIGCLDYTEAFNFPAERENSRVWEDKSGIDKNLENIRFEPKEFSLQCYCKASNISAAYALVNTLVTYMFTKGAFVLSFRDAVENIRECFICERSGTILSSINIREQNSLYVFKLGLRDVNPNAVKYKTSIVFNEETDKYECSILYTKGQTAVIYWGNGDKAYVSNSGTYLKDDFVAEGYIDVVIDIDQNADVVLPLIAEFSANVLGGSKPVEIEFTDESEGIVEIWSWNFGDGTTSAEQHPVHIYTNAGVYAVTLQVFNSAKGFDTETKVGYITIVDSKLLINDTDKLLINNTDKLLIN